MIVIIMIVILIILAIAIDGNSNNCYYSYQVLLINDTIRCWPEEAPPDPTPPPKGKKGEPPPAEAPSGPLVEAPVCWLSRHG